MASCRRSSLGSTRPSRRMSSRAWGGSWRLPRSARPKHLRELRGCSGCTLQRLFQPEQPWSFPLFPTLQKRARPKRPSRHQLDSRVATSSPNSFWHSLHHARRASSTHWITPSPQLSSGRWACKIRPQSFLSSQPRPPSLYWSPETSSISPLIGASLSQWRSQHVWNERQPPRGKRPRSRLELQVPTRCPSPLSNLLRHPLPKHRLVLTPDPPCPKPQPRPGPSLPRAFNPPPCQHEIGRHLSR